MDDLAELKAMCEALRTECIKFFEEGNKTAGTRARKMLQNVKQKAQQLRVSIQETKRAMDLVKFEQEQAGGGGENGVGVGAAVAPAQEGVVLQSDAAMGGEEMDFEGAALSNATQGILPPGME